MILHICNTNQKKMSHDNHSTQQNNKGLWYTYFGEGGAGVFAFIIIVCLLTWVFSVLKWG
jgi:hypothetical protein